MSIRTAISIVLIILAVGLCFWLFVRPVIAPSETVRFVDEKQLFLVGEDKEGKATFMYADLKDEVREWTKILAGFAPVISLLIAYLLKGRKR